MKIVVTGATGFVGKPLVSALLARGERVTVLVLRILEARLYGQKQRASSVWAGPRWPVLLLDDVLLELDVGRRRRLLELLPATGEGAQRFFTFLPEEPWQDYVDRSTLVYMVRDGLFESQNSI